jgi:hypothetical protein
MAPNTVEAMKKRHPYKEIFDHSKNIRGWRNGILDSIFKLSFLLEL